MVRLNFMEGILWLCGFIFISILMDLASIINVETAINKGTRLKLNLYSIKYTLSSCFMISIVQAVYIKPSVSTYFTIMHLILWCIVFLVHRVFIIQEISFKRRYKKLLLLSFILWAITFISLKQIGVII